MSFQLPKRTHLVHKAIEPRKLSASTAAKVAARLDDVWEVKYDGVHAVLIKTNGKAYSFFRTGEQITGAMDRQLRAMEALAQDNYVLFAEGWNENYEFSDINGHSRTHLAPADERFLKAIIFDMVPFDAFLAGKYEVPYMTRRKDVADLLFALRTFAFGNLFDITYSAATKAICLSHVSFRQDNHGEIFKIDGFMRKAREGHWVAGAGSEGFNLKDKDIVSVDLKVEELYEGEGKFTGMLGAFGCTYNSKPQRVGGGKLTDKQRKAIWENQTQADGGIGSIIEVHALGESTHGLLREPRYARTRFDKTEGE